MERIAFGSRGFLYRQITLKVEMKKLPAKYNVIAIPLVLSTLMSFIISGVSTWRALGLADGFLDKWMSGWLFSWIVAFPTVLLLFPVVRKIVGFFVAPPFGTK
jgi:hypothetical protein